MVGPAPGGAVALPRPGDAVRAAGFRIGVQADHFGAAVVPDPAGADDGGVHGDLREVRGAADGRAAALPVLHGGDGGVELFRGLPEQDVEHVRAELEPVREGVFPAHGGAGVDLDLEPDHVHDAVRTVPGVRGRISC